MVMRKQRKRILKVVGFASIALVLISGVAIANYQHLQRQAARIPSTIRNELTFSPFVLTLDSKTYKATDYKLSEVIDNVQLFSFVVSSTHKSATISEYTQPAEFTDIPEYKERFLTNVIKQYATVQTSNGTVYLGRQQKQDNKQLGVMIEKGLIVLLNPKTELTNSEWRILGEQLEIQKISS